MLIRSTEFGLDRYSRLHTAIYLIQKVMLNWLSENGKGGVVFFRTARLLGEKVARY